MKFQIFFALLFFTGSMAFQFRSSSGFSTRRERGSLSTLQMAGGKQANFGVFSPAVYAAKALLGEPKLNKIRGKAISLHSQAITEWCIFYGAYNLRVRLIRTAKKNGDKLGFLV